MSDNVAIAPEAKASWQGARAVGGNLQFRRALLLLALLGAWEFAAAFLVNPFWSSRPTLVIERLAAMTMDGSLWRHTSITLLEAGAGLMLGALVGIPLGVLLARAPRTSDTVEPLIMGIYGLPRVALAPLFILWFGIGLFSKIMMSFTMVVFVFLLNVREGVRSADPDLLDLMRSMRASPLYTARTVLLPGIVPWILAAFRLGIGLSLIGAVVGELVGSSRGLGWYIQSSGGQLDTTGVFTGLTVLMIIAMLANQLIALFEKGVILWR
ncbi:ABC transporter permease subunit [Aurantimonas aggregata]|uniref:ABC transporter permease subunit n=1 Tax=Aurantimonas aggregata TaxID=2047720 RepID=A0A6L9MKQ6_9HYPH|nr:ABC transporter permease [Aurantimonas aggregata]NDV88212.1 ABC transporter permease subunit [Aurantimonas aggregata]